MHEEGASRGTTLRSSAVVIVFALVAAILDGGVAVARTVSEEELVRAFLRRGPEKSIAAASRARTRAIGITQPYLPKPTLMLRREESFGSSTEFSTTVAGLSVSLEIGGRHGLRKKAASLDTAALAFQRQAEVVETLCQLRRRVAAAHAEQKIVALLFASQHRLERLSRDLKRLVSAGERAQFDLDRMLLLVGSHSQTLAEHRARLRGMLDELSSLSGLSITGVRVDARRPVATATRSGSITTPAIRALRMQAQAEARRSAAARRSWVPNLDLYGAYRVDVGAAGGPGHGYEAGLNLSLPVTASERRVQAVAEAKRKMLLATATRQQAARAARLAALQGRARELERALSSKAVDSEKLKRDAARRYLTGVGALSELVDTIRAANEAALQRAHTASTLRNIALEAACLRGVFDEKGINQLAREKTR